MITIPIGDLKPALAGLAKVVSTKAALECLRCVRVDSSPGQVRITGTDLDMFASVALPAAMGGHTESFLLPFDRLQSAARRLPANGLLHLEPGKITCDMGGSPVTENIAAPDAKEFPGEPAFEKEPVPLPPTFAQRFAEALACSSTDATRHVLNGVALDVSDRSGHYLVATDGRHLFSANSFELPVPESVTISKHRLLAWRGLIELPWSLATRKADDRTLVRIVAGPWTLTAKTLEGAYPNWRQVVPRAEQHRTTVTLPEDHDFAKLVLSLPIADAKDQPVDLVIESGIVSVRDSAGKNTIPLAGAKACGPDLAIRVNRSYLAKALSYGLTRIGLNDATSPLHFTREGRQMVVMPIRLADVAPEKEPDEASAEEQPTAPPEPQPERNTMTATNGQTTNGAARHTAQSSAEKPTIETAIEKLDVLKVTFREALAGLTELTALLRQSVRDQRAGEKEIQQVRQTLRTLQNVRI